MRAKYRQYAGLDAKRVRERSMTMHNFSLDELTDDSMNQSLSVGSEKPPEMISLSKQDVAGNAVKASLSGSREKKIENRNCKAFKLDFSDEGLLNGIILAEVLGKPKCLKRSRR